MRHKTLLEHADMNRYEILYSGRKLDGEGRALAELLAKDNGRYLYKDLRYMNIRHMPTEPADREDFLQDFFLDICCTGARTYRRGSFGDIENLRDNSDAVKWLMVCLRRYYWKDRTSKLRRIKKTKHALPRPKEVSIYDSVYQGRNGQSTGADGNGKEHGTSRDGVDNLVTRLTEISYEVYLSARKKPFSGLSLLEKEELEELEHTKRMIYGTVEEALSGLKKDEREIFRMYFFKGARQKEISKKTGMSIGKVRWLINTAKERLKETLPYEITSTKRWKQG